MAAHTSCRDRNFRDHPVHAPLPGVEAEGKRNQSGVIAARGKRLLDQVFPGSTHVQLAVSLVGVLALAIL